MSKGTGPDDLLASQGPGALQQVIEAATPANPEKYLEALLAKASDKLDVLAQVLDDQAYLVSVLQEGPGVRMKVETIYKKHGAKRSLDKALEDTERALRSEQKGAADASTDSPNYQVTKGVLTVQQNGTWQPLSNFDARIVADEIRDDGAERQRAFVIEGSLADGTELGKIRVPPIDFTNKPWWLSGWGASAIVYSGRLIEGHLRAGIQTLSRPVETVTYAHTGWRLLDGHWVYLHEGGAVGRPDVKVELGEAKKRFVLPASTPDPAYALRVALRLLDVAPRRVSMPVLLAAFRAPLMEVLPVDGMVHVFGQTGALKSSFCAVAQSFFGPDFGHTSLPASFTDTFASLEYKLHRYKDALVVVDEFVPRSADPNDDARKNVVGLIRLIGNGAPRGRQTSDLVARSSRPPRAMVLSTGEEVPDGQSAVARMLCLEVDATTVDRQVLSHLQREQRWLSHAMAGYLAFLAPRLEMLRAWAKSHHLVLKEQFVHAGVHLRAPSLAAHLALAAVPLAEYALHVGVFDADQARDFLCQAKDALTEALKRQHAEIKQEEPERRFLELLRELIETQAVWIPSAHEKARDHSRPLVGWRKGPKLLLLPDTTYGAVAEFAHRQKRPLALTPRATWRALRNRGVLTPGDGGHATVKRPIGDKVHRVLELHASALERADEEVIVPVQALAVDRPVFSAATDVFEPEDTFSETELHLHVDRR